MRPRAVFTFICLILLIIASQVTAATFVVPDDAELVAKSAAIVVANVEGSYAQETDGMIETIYELRVERSLKSFFRPDELLRVVSPGGMIGDRGVHVESAAHFAQGERVLVFLTRDNGRWTTTDLTLGKFRFVTSTAGEHLLVRDMEDVVGWNRRGQVHREKVRKQDGFLSFISETMRARPASNDYLVDISSVTLPPEDTTVNRSPIISEAPFAGATYTSWVSNQPVRWANIAAGVTYRKRADQNVSGVSDGGVSVIRNGLASWTNECGSVINLIYGGTTSTPSANFDGVNVVEFNDPQGRISGSWSGSGTVGLAFLSFQSSHTFEGRSWLSITDGDVVFQNGYPGTHAAFATAMTHELGHTIGWRHSNQNHQTGGACNSTAEQCTSAAVMNSSVSSAYGFTLQPWDINAAQSVYPGGTCGPVCAPPIITGQPGSSTISSGQAVTLSVGASGTTPFTYQWYIGSSGNTSNPVSGGTGSTLRVTPSTTTSYWVRVSNTCGSANSNTATLTVNPAPPSPEELRNRTDHDGDGKADLYFRQPADGQNLHVLMNGSAVKGAHNLPVLSGSWTPVGFGDFNRDGRDDIFWRNSGSGANLLWFLNGGGSVTQQAAPSMAVRWQVVGSGDFNGDGRFDIVWRDPSTGSNALWYMNGAARTEAPASTVSPSYHLGATGDFDGDGRFDFMWRNASTGHNIMWRQTINGTVVTTSSAPSSMILAASADVNGDDRWDLLWRVPGSGTNGLWLMNGPTYTSRTVPSMAPSWSVRAIGDFDGDGDHDVAWRNTNGSNILWVFSSGTVTSQQGLPGLSQSWQMHGYR